MGKEKIKKICLITPGHIASNPRLLKEATALENEGYMVHVIFTQNLKYLIEHDHFLLAKHPQWTYDILDLTRKSPDIWLRNKRNALLQKISCYLLSFFSIPFLWILALNRNYLWQLKKATRAKADLYIGHNLAALPVAVNSAKKNNVYCGFDAEDFHRHETSDNPHTFDVILKTHIEDRYLNLINYFTAASPLIAEAYKERYPQLDPVTVNNVFELKHQPPLNLNRDKCLKLFWFSQTIGKNRGLEDIIYAINQLNNPLIQLHLLGNLSGQDHSYFNSLATFKINYYPPILNDEIFNLSAQFDAGLALEINEPFNREICLTNKIFTYLLAGLALITSNTKAQQQFINNHPGIGLCYPIGDINRLKEYLLDLLNSKELLNTYKSNAYILAKEKYNWELESLKFIQIIEAIFQADKNIKQHIK